MSTVRGKMNVFNNVGFVICHHGSCRRAGDRYWIGSVNNKFPHKALRSCDNHTYAKVVHLPKQGIQQYHKRCKRVVMVVEVEL